MFETIAGQFRRTEGFQTAVSYIRNGITPCMVDGMCDSARPFFLTALLKETGRKGLVVVPEEKDAYQLQKILETMFPSVLVYPSRDFIFENILSYSRESTHERLHVLSEAVRGNFDVLITVPDALMQYTMPPDVLRSATRTVRRGETCDLPKLCRYLEKTGYVRSELVEGPGQYAVHGGILDVFSIRYPNPVRIDFFGDEADTVAFFDPLTQRTVEQTEECEIPPCTEWVVDDAALSRVKEEFGKLLDGEFEAEKYRGQIMSDREALEEKGDLNYPDRYAVLLYPKPATLLDALGDVLPVVWESRRVKDRAEGFYRETYGVCESLAKRGLMRLKSGLPLATAEEFLSFFRTTTVLMDAFRHTGTAFRAKAACSVPAHPLDPVSLRKQSADDVLRPFAEESETVVFVSVSAYGAEQAQRRLEEKGIRSLLYPDRLYPETVHLYHDDRALLKSGFTVPSIGFSVLAETVDAYHFAASRRRKSNAQMEKITSYTDLSEGDLVVHVNHGIGRFSGIQNMTAAGVTRDYIKLVYADGGILYVPCEQMDLVSRYVGSDNAKLNKLGGSEWKKAKVRARASASLIAKDLIRLYAERMQKTGFAYPPDDAFQTVFESEFEYDETEGQQQASKEIKRDMERPYPMDRLLCGDVGFGKTEVALRAAFKCVFSGKQAAVLVPTTILALQHYQTITERFRSYPVEIGMVSRFVSPAEQKKTLEKLADGRLNIIIGTHRLLQKDVKFKDLGLLIVDEEQRFGVKHKETLKQLSRGVDVLTLSATPIPRTLNMALSGIRDMSVLEEAPVDRVPVQTFVMEYDETAVLEAIRREFRRGGQVFYLYNRTDGIYSKAAALKEKFPEREVAVAHGQMDKEELSRVWKRMMDGGIDLLVCTTIIETGINLPNANTLIIENADRMGLSQLHQIRGRVGRSSRKAYAYLTYRPDTVLNEVAEKRLQAIQEFTEFGSGFKIAMRDLQLRGAGSLLGAEQSGQMEVIGYDLYVKILEDAVNQEKGLEPKAERNCIVDLRVDAYIPESYVSSQKVRMDMYKRIGDAETSADAADVKEEMCDRFGPLPAAAETLIRVSVVRHLAMELGFESIEQKETTVCFFHPSPDQDACLRTSKTPELRGRVMASFGGRPHVAVRFAKGEDVTKLSETFLAAYKNCLQIIG